MRGMLIVVAAAVVAAVLLLPSLLVSSVAIGDANPATNSAGVVSDGWVDFEVQGMFFLTNAAGPPQWSLQQVWANETLGRPGGPVLTAFRAATVETSCTGSIEMTPTGPQLDAVTAKSEVLTFTMSSPAQHFHFGHLYLYKDQTYRVGFGVYVDGCFGLTVRTLISTFEIQMKFDGSSEQFDGSGH